MSQITGLIDGSNVNHDYQITALANALMNPGVISGLLVSTNSVAVGEGLILCTRTNGQQIMVSYTNTGAVTIDTSGTKKVYIAIDQGVIDDGSSNSPDGSGIATIRTGASYPASNYIPLASITGGVITDQREFISRKGLVRGTKSTNIASDSTTNLATLTGNYAHITGTTTITSFGTAAAGTQITLVFDGILTLTHNATSLILPGGANITTSVGDSAIFESEGSGNWKCVSYTKANGKSLVETALSSLIAAYGDGSDGDVVISTTTTLTRDMYYNNLTLNNAIELKPNGFRIFVKGTLTRLGTGKISAYGGNGGNGGGGLGGAAGTVANTEGTLPASTPGVNGANVVGAGIAGINKTFALVTTGAAGGNDGSGVLGGASGSNTGTSLNPLKRYTEIHSLLHLDNQINISVGSGSGAGGTWSGTGGGGGSGATGGIIFVEAYSIVANNTNTLFDAHGGIGGNGGNSGNHGAGGGGGGNGGIVIVINSVTSHSLSTLTNVTGGTGGNGGTGPGGAGLPGGNGNVGVLKTLLI